MIKSFSICVGLILFCLHAHAAIRLPDILGNHMVVQADEPIKLWGKAKAGESLQAKLLNQDGNQLDFQVTKVEPNGTWELQLKKQAAGRRLSILLSGGGGEPVNVEDVLAGEVWLCSGQSNMRWTVAKSKDGKEEIAAASYPDIRLFQVAQRPAARPQSNLKGKWVRCSPETIGNFSAAGYYFGRFLFKELNQPVGLIDSTWGGTPIQAWIPLDAMEANPKTDQVEKDYKAYFAQPPKERKKSRGTWIYGAKSQKGPARLYNGMIEPLTRLPIRGVVWSQGEGNDREGKWGGPSLYHTLFPMLIESWRKKWGRDFPFFYVELANYMTPPEDPIDSTQKVNWAYMREAQASALSLPQVFPISAIDVGEADEIHYADKQTVGKRLGMAILRHVYNKAVLPYLSPRLKNVEIQDGKARLKMKHAEGGLKTDDGHPPRGFAIQGEDKTWKWAQAKIEGDEIIVWHPEIKEPQAIRYAWASNPDVNVYNQTNLPLMPFRTDKDAKK